jgi:hypothetical protein
LLEPIFATFGEGLETADLRAARHLLATLRDRSATLPVVPHPSSASGA